MHGIDEVYCVIICATNFTLILVAIYCFYCSFWLKGILQIVVVTLCLTSVVILGLFVTAWAEFHRSSGKVLSSLSKEFGKNVQLRRSERRWMEKSLDSLTTLKIPVMGLFYVDKLLLLQDMKIMSEGVIFLLVNF